MSPTQTTCRRKRGLLRTFGSRRRCKEFAVSASIQVEGLHGNPVHEQKQPLTAVDPGELSAPRNPHHGSLRANNAYLYNRSPDSTAVMSRISDEINTYATGSPSLPHWDVETPPERSSGCFTEIEKPNVSPASQDSKSGFKANTCGAETSSMTCTKSFHAMSLARRNTISIARLRDSFSPPRLLDQTADSSENDGVPREEVNVFSVKTCRKIQKGPTRDESSPGKALRKFAHRATDDETNNNKVAELLAHMNAGKPTALSRAPNWQPILPRGAESKRLAKLLGRLYSKSASPVSVGSQKRSKLVLDNMTSPLRRGTEPGEQSQAFISTREIRLNEDVNLDRTKVRKMVGAHVIRKPAKSMLHSSRSHENVVADCETESWRLTSAGRVFWSSINPFDTEEGFEYDLDKGILHASPVGSSTPRILVGRASDSTLSQYSVRDMSGSSLGPMNLAKAVHLDRSKTKDEKKIRQLNFYPDGDKQKHSQGYLYQDDGVGATKKHPSPSKRDLEELEKAFRQYRPRRERYKDGGDMDELAAGHSSCDGVLIPKDGNTRLQGNEKDGCAKVNRRQPSAFSCSPLNLRHGEVNMLRKAEVKPVSIYKPKDRRCDDFDELL